ncbi:MAG: hypothetical protein IKM59_01690 [Oscillospiraceae bacterium]|nr:hypothetical protein [Oscillospiraceae bacterium]
MAGNIKGKQLGALAFCACTVTGVLFLSGSRWMGVLLVALMSMLLVSFGRPLGDRRLSGVGKALTVPVFLWNIAVVGMVAWKVAGIYGTENPLPGLLLLLLAAYAGKKRVVVVVGAVLLFFLLGIYGSLFFFALPDIQIENLRPGKSGDLWPLVYGFLPMQLLYMYREEEAKGRGLWCSLIGVFAVGTAVMTEGLGARDFYTAAKSVNLMGAMERLEPFVAATVTAGGFCLPGLLMDVNRNIWETLWERKKNFPEIAILLLFMGICIVANRVDDRVWFLGTAVCWVVIPILTQFVVVQKKV